LLMIEGMNQVNLQILALIWIYLPE
jgi:hypothetical protein